MTFHYRPDVLEQLLMHGVRPSPTTRPAAVFRFVSDLYRVELRRLKDRRVNGTIAARDYAGQVVALRQRYPLVSVPVQLWTLPGTPAEPDDIPLC
ncbi:MAG: hypothetical protein NTY02_15810 [Acidobacteria bacterium]|nr:hypothetical protein [Acidobacteriota bacterium]